MKNPIIAQLRRIRDARAERHGHDFLSMGRELMELEPWMEKKTVVGQKGRFRPVSKARR